MDKIDLDKFYKLKDQTELEYKKINSIYCPALKSKVFFNSDGFHHLRYDQSRCERNKMTQRTKFINLSKAVRILKLSTTVQEYRRNICAIGKPDKGGFRKTKLVEWFGFFAITSFTHQTRINVVVRRIGEDGQYHFWSVMPYWTLTNGHRVIGAKQIEDE